jgi:hypothetical protein
VGPDGGTRVNCENPFTKPTPAPERTPEPKPTPTPTPTPTPKVDSDGDGITDGVDACPNKGASAWGLDASGCPKPAPDTDGDGLTDDVDACPNKGDEGFGVDSTGCPNPPPPTYQSTCEDHDGTYDPGPVPGTGLQPVCYFVPPLASGNQWNSAFVALADLCTGIGMTSSPFDWMACIP